MTRYLYLFVFLIVATSCRDEKAQQDETPAMDTSQQEEMVYSSYGETIDDKGTISVAQLQEMTDGLKTSDTLTVKLASSATDVCVKKGCWMKLDNGERDDIRVSFKDYGFFVPTDLGKQDVIVSGKAFIKETSVDDLRHYAEDAGKSAEEIAAITTTEKAVVFVADGVLIKK